eukprot:4388714-Pyramimonas_sp.AAC.1
MNRNLVDEYSQRLRRDARLAGPVSDDRARGVDRSKVRRSKGDPKGAPRAVFRPAGSAPEGPPLDRGPAGDPKGAA